MKDKMLGSTRWHAVLLQATMKLVVLTSLSLLVATFAERSPTGEVTLTISAEKRLLEVVWDIPEWTNGDRIFLTNQPLLPTTKFSRAIKILVEIVPESADGWVTTNIRYDYGISRNISILTGCHAYWVSYIDVEYNLKATGCLKPYPKWMNNLRPEIEEFKISDLLIAGTHDSGSYRVDFDPENDETLITRYALTQDEDIRGQLMHGARYLDIRPAYYKLLPGKPFYVNHGITKQRPMAEVIEQVRDFVRETQEIVIFGMKEFPFGFTDVSVHVKFVEYLKEEFGDLIIDPVLMWNATLGELWKRGQYVFLAYDESSIVEQFNGTLFPSVNQRWGNVQTWPDLEDYLREIYRSEEEIEDDEEDLSRPKSDMAELTADAAGEIIDKYGGLRRMADNVNSGVSNLYRNELSDRANIVALDFIRGTTFADLAFKVNKKRIKGT